MRSCYLPIGEELLIIDKILFGIIDFPMFSDKHT